MGIVRFSQFSLLNPLINKMNAAPPPPPPPGSNNNPTTPSNKTEGRKKIKIQKIENTRSRQVTFLKRKNGLMKKAMELVSIDNILSSEFYNVSQCFI